MIVNNKEVLAAWMQFDKVSKKKYENRNAIAYIVKELSGDYYEEIHCN